jgi:hypothetical protein
MKKFAFTTKFFSAILLGGALVALSGNAFAQVPTYDLGPDPMTLPPDNITNYNSAANTGWPDGLNYFNDNWGGWNVGGQTFTAPPSNCVLTSVALKTEANAGGGGTGPQTFYLRIYSVSEGTNATLLATYTSPASFSFTATNWIMFSNLNVALNAGATYAYTWGRPTDGVGWCQIYAGGGNTYASGEVCLIQLAGGTGTVTLGSSHNYDANFAIGIGPLIGPVPTPPTFVTPVTPVYGGTTFSLIEVSGGDEPLYYQWLTDGGGGTLTNIPGATATNLIVTPGTAGTYQYACIVSNASGVVTSAVSQITIQAPSVPIITADIQAQTELWAPSANVYAYANGRVNYTATFGAGTWPNTNQWQADTNSGGFMDIAGETTNVWVLTNLQATADGNYQLTAANSIGNATSSVSALTIVAGLPAPDASQPYAYAVYTNNPVAYWRFSETIDSTLNTVQTYDFSGNNLNGTFGGSCTDNQSGPQSPAYPGFESTNTAAIFLNSQSNAFVSLPAQLNLNTNTVTITAWIQPMSLINNYYGLFMWRGTNGDAAGFGFGGGTLQNSTMAQLGYTWNTNGAATWGWGSGLYPPMGQWSFVALTITPTNTTIHLCYADSASTNVLKAVQSITNYPEAFNTGTLRIGCDNYDGRTFNGYIDEVAVFARSLSDSEVQGLFLASLGSTGVAATISVQPPSSINTYAGQPLQISALASGVPSPTYQWQAAATGSGVFADLSNGGAYSGVNSNNLTTASTNSMDYRVVAVNSLGAATSAVCTVTLAPRPTGQWTVNFQHTNNINQWGLVGSSRFTGQGVLGTGTYWNSVPGSGAWSWGTWTSVEDYLDDGSTPSGINCSMTGASAAGASGTGYPETDRRTLLSQDITVWGYQAGAVTLTGVPDGIYNVALYGIDGPWNDRGATFVVRGYNGNQTNGTVNASFQYFIGGDNVVLFNNVWVLGGTLYVDMYPTTPVPTHDPNGEGCCNAVQLQLVKEIPTVHYSWDSSQSQLTLTWAGGGSSQLLESTNVLGPWVTNYSATSPFVVVPDPNLPARFYRALIP